MQPRLFVAVRRLSRERALTAAQALDCVRAAQMLRSAYEQQPCEQRLPGLYRAIDLYQSALAVLDPRTAPAEWGAAQHGVGNALRVLPGDRERNLQNAIACFEASLQVFTRQISAQQWATTMTTLGVLWSALGELGGKDAKARLKRAVECFEEALTVRSEAATPGPWSLTQQNLANAWARLAKAGEQEAAAQAIAAYRNALRVRTRANAPMLWARTMWSMAQAFLLLPERTRAEQLPAAIQAAEEALNALTPEAPADWAQAHLVLGDAYAQMVAGDRNEHLGRAIAHLQAALPLLKGPEQEEGRYRTQLRLADALLDLETGNRGANLTRAIELYRACLENPPARIEDRVSILDPLARAYQASGDRDSAVAACEEALALVTEGSKEWGRLERRLGDVFSESGLRGRPQDLQRALACYGNALRAYAGTEHAEDRALVLVNMGRCYQLAAIEQGREKLQAAAQCYESALRVWTRDEAPIDWAKTASSLGLVRATLAASLEQVREAIAMGEAALNVLTRKEYPRDWAIAQANVGRSYLTIQTGNREENLQAAIARFALALEELNPQRLPSEWASVQSDRGIAYARLKSEPREHNLGQALACWTATLAVYTERKYPREWAATQANIGALHLRLAELEVPGAADESVKALEAALRVLDARANPIPCAQVNLNLGTALREQNPDRALQCYRNALEVLNPANQLELWVLAQDLLGSLYAIRSEDPEDQRQAIECFERELQVLTPEGHPWEYLRAVRRLAQTYYFGRQWNLAAARFYEAAGAVERLRMESLDDTMRLEVLRESLVVFDQGMVAAVEAGQYERALEFAERERARNLAAQLRRAQYRPRAVDAGEWERYQHVLGRLAAERRAPSWKIFDENAAASYQERLALLSGLRREASALERHFAAGDPAFASMEATVDATRIVALARKLDAVIVDFRLTAEVSYAFLVGPDGAFTRDDAVRLDLVVKQNAIDWPGFAGVMKAEDVASGRGEATVRDSFKLVMAPVHARLRQRFPNMKRLVIIPSRVLALLPLHAAQSEEGAPCLLDEYEIAYAPSTAILELCVAREATPQGESRLMAVQNPDGSLPFASWEVEEIVKLFPEGSRRILAGSAATREAVESNCAFGTEGLFSCHGAYDASAPEKSSLKLADGNWTLGELLRADFRKTSLIVMSACTSGVVELQSLDVDEYFGLPAACLVAGAQTVVASLWQVNDAATALLMQRFHSNLYTAGMGRARALQEAQTWLRDMNAEEAYAALETRQLECEDEQAAADAALALMEIGKRGAKPFAHPYWWAAFQCIGSGWDVA